MPFDGVLVEPHAIAAARGVERSDDFRRGERLVVLGGASALGALMGFACAMALGRTNAMTMIAIAAPVLALALYFTAEMLREGLRRRAYGWASSAVLNAAALLAWPMTALFAPVSPSIFWLAPGLALTALTMLAFCWGSKAGAYRVGAVGLMIAGVTAQQATALMLGG